LRAARAEERLAILHRVQGGASECSLDQQREVAEAVFRWNAEEMEPEGVVGFSKWVEWLEAAGSGDEARQEVLRVRPGVREVVLKEAVDDVVALRHQLSRQKERERSPSPAPVAKGGGGQTEGGAARGGDAYRAFGTACQCFVKRTCELQVKKCRHKSPFKQLPPLLIRW
jgi:hypothetical protein